MKLTERLAEYAVKLKFEDLPNEVIKASKKVFLDLLGTTFAGSTALGSHALVDLIKDFGGKKESTIIAYDEKVPAPMAALANGTIGHALDFDDTHDTAILHTSANVIPAALSLAERNGVSGKDFLTAATLGMDVQCRMGLACKHRHTRYGWIYSSTLGYFGATIAAGKVLGLDKERMSDAIGIVYSETAGNLQTIVDGALAKRLQLGLAAKGGVLAALLAEVGFTGPREALEGKYGFYNVYQRGEYDSGKLLRELGKEFEVVNLSLKPYPCCRASHTSIDAAFEATRKYDIKPEDIDSIEASVNKLTSVLVCEPLEAKHNPRNIVDLQFNIPYTVACVLIKGDVSIEDFTREALEKKDVLELAKKVRPKVDPKLERPGRALHMPVILKIKTKDGRVHKTSVEFPKGHPTNPMTMEEVYEKFKKCIQHAVKPLPEERVNQIVKMVDNIEKVDDMARLTKLIGVTL